MNLVTNRGRLANINGNRHDCPRLGFEKNAIYVGKLSGITVIALHWNFDECHFYWKD